MSDLDKIKLCKDCKFYRKYTIKSSKDTVMATIEECDHIGYINPITGEIFNKYSFYSNINMSPLKLRMSELFCGSGAKYFKEKENGSSQ